MPNLAFGNFFLLRVPGDLFDLFLECCKGIHFWTVAQQAGSGSAGSLILYYINDKVYLGTGTVHLKAISLYVGFGPGIFQITKGNPSI